jgi:transposase
LLKKLNPLSGRITRIVYEAGPTGFTLARRLQDEDLPIQVISPSHCPRPHARDNKSDRLDCRRLAQWAAQGLLRPVPIPTEQEEADRQIVRTREQMLDDVRQAKTQIKSFLLQHGLKRPKGLSNWTNQAVAELQRMDLRDELRFSLNLLLQKLMFAKQLFKEADRRAKALAEKEPRHKVNADRLRTVPGVGPITAIKFLTELIQPERFDDPRQVARYAGLAPRVNSSGESRREGNLEREGNARLRTAMVEAAWQWVWRDPVARERFNKMAARDGVRSKRASKRAICAMARRLLIILWRMHTNREDYRFAKAA